MRKPRDLDAELEALNQRAKALKSRRVIQFGELVVATGADHLDPETLVGALLSAVSSAPTEHTAWREQGAAFFRRARGGPASGRGGKSSGERERGASSAGGAPPS
ncbi:conjugal transfer protein TraD [Phenylobacterium sp.]|uniref:conjugal transfer protein TraD n=1 Tax=Phenylobacterium sp. TaxID=1871053 RepID=UPI0011F86738|nr:conjugal transfer protein TraD [Phenylobacterium sp.]THD61621.1 MAG: conjugal transfer protein TraC [Phenylobacterium sp.]